MVCSAKHCRGLPVFLLQYKFDALITTYEMVLKDADELRPIK